MVNRYALVCLLVSLLIVLPLISAEQESLGTFKTNDCVQLRQSCGNCTYSNITQVLYPNSYEALNMISMERNNENYNYTFCSTSQNGQYIVVGFSDVDGIKTMWAYDFFVTPTGVIQQSIFNNAIPLILILIAIALLVLGYVMKSYPIGFISATMWMASGVYIIIYGFNSYTDNYTTGLGIVLAAIGFIIAMVSGYEGVKDSDDDNDEEAKEEVDEHDYFK
jgi:hypothetical protein